MADNKKSFVLYCDIIKTVEKLPNETAGELFKHLLSYVNDEEPETDNLLVEVAFEPIKQQLKRDLVKWDEIREKRSEAGKKSAEAKKNKRQQKQQVCKEYDIKDCFIVHLKEDSYEFITARDIQPF